MSMNSILCSRGLFHMLFYCITIMHYPHTQIIRWLLSFDKLNQIVTYII